MLLMSDLGKAQGYQNSVKKNVKNHFYKRLTFVPYSSHYELQILHKHYNLSATKC